MQAVVTGATGFVGRELCAALTAAGASLTLAGRSPECDLPLELAQPGMPRLPAGVDAVFHLAGLAHRAAPAVLQEQINHRAVLALARAAAAAGARHFLFLSSVKALGPAPGPAPRTETAAPRGGDAYGAAKYRAEAGLRALQPDTAMRITVLRPALIYGPGAAGNLAQLRRWVLRGRPLPPECGGRSLVARADLVRLLLALATRDGAGFRLWQVTDGDCYSTRRLCLALARALPRERLPPTLPAAAWRVGGLLRDLAGGRRPGSSAAAILGWDRYSAARVRCDTGWAPRLRFEDVAPQLIARPGRC